MAWLVVVLLLAALVLAVRPVAVELVVARALQEQAEVLQVVEQVELDKQPAVRRLAEARTRRPVEIRLQRRPSSERRESMVHNTT